MLEAIGHWVINIISTFGYFGVVVMMAIESALIPLPSEIIMPFSGYLASIGRFNLTFVALAGAIGNVIGSLVAYGIGYWGRERLVRRFIRNYGKWILHTEKDLDDAEVMLHKYKDWVVFGTRMLPGVRTIISLPCGVARLPLGRFIVLTFVGSLIWSYFLAWIGFTLGEHWDTLGPYFHKVDGIIIIAILAIGGFYIYHKFKSYKKHSKKQ